MIKYIAEAVLMAIRNIRARFFHTFLSVLGVVIGVAALVAILSLVDGMEQYTREQLSSTTSVNTIMISTEPFKTMNGIKMRKKNPAMLNYTLFDSLRQSLSRPALGQLVSSLGAEVRDHDSGKVVGARIMYTSEPVLKKDPLLAGRYLDRRDVRNPESVIIINTALAKELRQDTSSFGSLIGKRIEIRNGAYTVAGITRSLSATAEAFIPISLLPAELHSEYPPIGLIEAASTEDVVLLEEEIQHWLKVHHKTDDPFQVQSNRVRVEQVTKAFTLTRIIMGSIVGISVIVGGVGIMNVLLISITQRTTEIGILKAVGAKRRDILIQFLSESVVISCLGSAMGLVFGILISFSIQAIAKAMVDAPFQLSFSTSSLVTISVLAVLIGIIFGTYPAVRAARLDPVEAIRRE